MDLIYNRRCPSYLRLHKQGEPTITSDNTPVVPGALRFYGGDPTSKIAILSTGYAAQGIHRQYPSPRNCSLYTTSVQVGVWHIVIQSGNGSKQSIA